MSFFCKRNRIIILLSALLTVIVISSGIHAQANNGFDLTNATISEAEIFSGGPPRDGIPAIDKPDFIAVNQVNYLLDNDIVIGLIRGNIAKAYPTRILVWHEIVNDIIDNTAVAVTYCPLCGTGMVFDRTIDNNVRSFGVSGLLYQSDVLMYDRESESLWSQLAMKAISGPSVGKQLDWLASEHMTWKAWRKKYPDGQVLSIDTGYHRNYGRDAYASYFASDKTMFPVPHTRQELSNKTKVIGVFINGKAKAYPVNALPSGRVIIDSIENKKIKIRYDARTKHPEITNSNNESVPSVVVFWFAWQAFYPDTLLWQPSS